MTHLSGSSLYERIYAVIRQIPAGQVSTYGLIARIVGQGDARTVGYALAAVTEASGVPWQRVINSQGRISLRGAEGYGEQRTLLEAEGIQFDAQGRVDLKRFGWSGPGSEWLEAHGYDPLWFMKK